MLDGDGSAVACEPAIGTDYAVARHNNGYRIGSVGIGNGPYCTGTSKHGCDPEIRHSRAIRYFKKLKPHPLLKISTYKA